MAYQFHLALLTVFLTILIVLGLLHSIKMIAYNAFIRGWNHDLKWAGLSFVVAAGAFALVEAIWNWPTIAGIARASTP